MEYQEGGVNDFVHKLRGRMKFPNLVLKRGITHEEAFTKWFLGVPGEDRAARAVAHDARPDLKPVRTWSFAGAFPVKWTGPDFKARLGRRRDRDASRSPTRA